MAVYTLLTEDDVHLHLTLFNIGQLVSCEGIAEGVENSNFLLHTTKGKFILTLFEKRVKPDELPYFLQLMAYLDARGIRCPKPVPDADGYALHMLKNRPATILTFLDGSGVRDITPAHMPLLGAYVAKMHVAAKDFPARRANTMSFDAWHALARKIRGRTESIAPGLDALIEEELSWLAAHWPEDLPGGPVHADLFPDNVFFEESPFRLSGVIDFYFACDDFWMYDLAIVINAWCFDKEHRFREEYVASLCAAYQRVRAFTEEENAAMPVLLRGAALRFLLTRAHDLIFHPEGALVTPKDPREYLAKLEFFRSVSA